MVVDSAAAKTRFPPVPVEDGEVSPHESCSTLSGTSTPRSRSGEAITLRNGLQITISPFLNSFPPDFGSGLRRDYACGDVARGQDEDGQHDDGRPVLKVRVRLNV